jgi:hypothetical protein
VLKEEKMTLEDHIEDQILKLKSPKASLRYEACEYLRVAPSITPDAIKALVKALSDNDPTVAEVAKRALEVQAPTEIPSEIPVQHNPPEPIITPSETHTPINIPGQEIHSYRLDSMAMPNGSPNTPEYIFALEKRIMYLEAEIDKVASVIKKTKFLDRDIKEIEELIPNSDLLSNSFFTRAFAVWGHYFVAQLIIGLGIGAVYVVLILIGGILLR